MRTLPENAIATLQLLLLLLPNHPRTNQHTLVLLRGRPVSSLVKIRFPVPRDRCENEMRR